MGYQKHNFKSGDVLTAKIMNEIEQGIVDAGSSQTNLELTKTINNVKAVFAGLQQKNIFAVAEIENTAEKRQTADGATNGITVLDGSYATVKKIQGKTVASKNLVDIPTQTLTGSDWGRELWTGSLTGTFTFSYNEEYSFVEDVSSGLIEFTVDGSLTYVAATKNNFGEKTLTGTLTKIRIVNNGLNVGTLSNFMLNYGSTALPYQPYFAGLKNAKISGLKSVHRNMLNSAILLQAQGWTETDGVYSGHVAYLYSLYKDTEGGLLGKLNLQDQVSISLQAKQANGTSATLMIGVLYTDLTRDYLSINSLDWQKYTLTTQLNKTIDVIYISYNSGETVYIKDLCIKIGANDYEYEPYVEITTALPETVELGEWDYTENGKIVKQTGTRIFTGDEVWWKSGESDEGGSFFATGFSGYEEDLNYHNCISDKFPYDHSYRGYPCAYLTVGCLIVFPNVNKLNQTITTIEQWIAYLQEQNANGTPLTIAYKLATPTVTPISDDLEYQVWDKGQEIMQVENTGAIPTITADYYILGGTTE